MRRRARARTHAAKKFCLGQARPPLLQQPPPPDAVPARRTSRRPGGGGGGGRARARVCTSIRETGFHPTAAAAVLTISVV